MWCPSQDFFLSVNLHNVYSGCAYCIEEGNYLEHRLAYLNIDSPLWTDESFGNKSDSEYHKESNSPLIKLPINITAAVALDL